jgi:hypothetical protein
MSGKRPKYTRTPDGGLLSMSCYEICRLFGQKKMNSKDVNRDAETWRDAADDYKRGIEYELSWSHNPFIEKRCEKRGRQMEKEATSLGTNGICTKKPGDDNIKQQLRRQP